MNNQNVRRIPLELPRLDWAETIYDPFWRYFAITQLERDLLKIPCLNRLRNIKQLSFAYLSFAGASHTRYEHSIGTMFVADTMLKYIYSEGRQAITIKPHLRQMLRIAALFHDLGHPPFSHALEDLILLYPDLFNSEPKYHEQYTYDIIMGNEHIYNIVSNYCKKQGIGIVDGEPDENDIKRYIANIAYLATGKLTDGEYNPRPDEDIIIKQIFRPIIDNDIDADKIDYLMRDNHACGLKNTFDFDSVRGNIIFRNRKLFFTEKIYPFIDSLHHARFRLVEKVHHDKWNILFTTIMTDKLFETIKGKNNKSDYLKNLFTNFTDATLVTQVNDVYNSYSTIFCEDDDKGASIHLKFKNIHSSIRIALDIISSKWGQKEIPEIQKSLREIFKDDNIWVKIYSVKPPELKTTIIGNNPMNKGDKSLLEDSLILRGIIGESVMETGIVVYSKKKRNDLKADETIIIKLNLPCDNCCVPWESNNKCIANLDRNQQILAMLLVKSYRNLIKENDHKIISIDFIIAVLYVINKHFEKANKTHLYPDSFQLYRVVKSVAVAYKTKYFDNKEDINEIFKNKFDLDDKCYFMQEIQKYVFLGLIASDLRIDKLYKPIFRLQLNDIADFYITKIRNGLNVKEFSSYKTYIEEVIKITTEKIKEKQYFSLAENERLIPQDIISYLYGKSQELQSQ